ncbi:hypothetical protein KBY24_09865 [Ruegeria pomeroyi]|uniref:Uncharacterized protein n=2 Tax=Ruegeria TaxID=97050 RepID=A0A9Q3WDW5_9RHOB|nr:MULTISPECIES: hypothetical protein [Ruegeria]MCE8512614.1 hypothetical protein [Ruegeria pomeroyi]MCE8525395.1 hypothetical protein [Ruegeria pomeroyi]MCE8529427.1 hypothetical protein [Ruegeria pomeroyi]MCE8533693.1 hypothetical protein [Ruegeria pomeroyi]MCE8538580.1 hypothetical protein [Ruegeria pomeroyi]
MHRKFIALVLSTAIAVTGVSVSQARAADAHDILGGLAAIAILGAAVHHYDKKKDRRRQQEHATRNQHNPYPTHDPHRRAKPLPTDVARYNLPSRCLREADGYRGHGPVLGARCLTRHYGHANSLPQQCKVSYWNGERTRNAYEPNCLRQFGYRVAYSN